LDSYSIAPYLRYASGAWYLDASAGYAFNEARVSRSIGFSSGYDSISGTTSGLQRGSGFVSRIETGYRLQEWGGLALTPFLALNSLVFAQRGFTSCTWLPSTRSSADGSSPVKSSKKSARSDCSQRTA